MPGAGKKRVLAIAMGLWRRALVQCLYQSWSILDRIRGIAQIEKRPQRELSQSTGVLAALGAVLAADVLRGPLDPGRDWPQAGCGDAAGRLRPDVFAVRSHRNTGHYAAGDQQRPLARPPILSRLVAFHDGRQCLGYGAGHIDGSYAAPGCLSRQPAKRARPHH